MKDIYPKLEELSLFEINSTFSYCTALLNRGMKNHIATFDLVVRDMPTNRSFMVFGGIEEILNFIENMKYSKKQINILLKTGLIDKEMAKYLKKFKFTGDVYSMKEGTIFFPGETIIKVRAPIIEANLIHSFLLSSVPSNAVFLTKCTRAKIAAKGKPVITNGVRGLGFEVGMKYARAAFITDMGDLAHLAPSVKYNMPIPRRPVKAAFHVYMKSFPTEIEAFRTFTNCHPNFDALLLVDTYNFKKGTENAIIVCKELKKKNKGIAGIFVDSGDLLKNCIYVRKELDNAGLTEVKILAATNMEEYKIEKLESQNAPIDSYLAITEMVTCSDYPKLEIIYKMSEIFDGKVARPTMKMTPKKRNFPGNKQMYRVIKNGKFEKDIIGLEDEEIKGIPLLHKVMKRGRIILRTNLQEIRAYAAKERDILPEHMKVMIPKSKKIPVELSKNLKKLIKHQELTVDEKQMLLHSSHF
ncbi:MAG: nicotinate phosphoribosyltransferase [archaeon]